MDKILRVMETLKSLGESQDPMGDVEGCVRMLEGYVAEVRDTGAQGGRSRSEAKCAANKRNVEKRWAKGELVTRASDEKLRRFGIVP